jgi:hypothetical protein
MARWKLDSAHYLNVPGTQWEQKETARGTGKQIRKTYPVPLYLDPRDPADWNYQPSGDEEGRIIVCHEGMGAARDIVFVGSPTPEMTPIDDEARTISASFTWANPINEFDAGMTYSEKMLIELQTKVAGAISTIAPPTIDPALAETLAVMSRVMEQNNQLLASLVTRRS